MIDAKFLLAAIAAVVVGGTTAFATGGTGGTGDVLSTGSPSPEVSETPSASPTAEVENVPQGKAYGWWRNHGVLLEKPGNGPKPKVTGDPEDGDSEIESQSHRHGKSKSRGHGHR